MSRLRDEQRAEFKRYKEDVKTTGKPFFPYAMLHDTIMSLVVVGVIIALACIWYWTAGDTDDGKGLEAGLLGPWFAEKADPGTFEFVPRPDWFFYFLFYLLRIFKWPETVVLGTVGVPTLLLILLIGLHLYLVVRLGVTSPPWSATAAGRERPDAIAGAREGLIRDAAPEGDS